MRQGLELVRKKLIGVLAKLARFAEEYKDMPCMAYTHCQPAQPTTVGKRATLWANELVMDLQEIDHRLATLQLRGVKGTTGTQASFMELFKGDADKIRAVDASIAREMGFDPKAVIPVSGQTYSRKVDAFVLNALAGIGQSCMKFATDLRLLANFKEMEEPFEKNQIGSSATKSATHALQRILRPEPLPDGGRANPAHHRAPVAERLGRQRQQRAAMAESFWPTPSRQRSTHGIVVYSGRVRSRLTAERSRPAEHAMRAPRGTARSRTKRSRRHCRRQAGQGRRPAQRHGGPHCCRPRFWPDQGGDRGRSGAGELCGPCTPAGGGVHRQRAAAHL